jgi:glucose/arabinose dehydrogenase
MKSLFAACALAAVITPAFADEPDGLKLPPGFHASVVAEGLGAVRHMAVRANGDLYISTPRNRAGFGGGIIAVELDKDHKLVGTPQHFGAVDGGTGIRFYKGALYASTASRIYRYTFSGKSLLPNPEPQVVVDGMPVAGSANRVIAFDGKGGLYVSVPGVGNICADPATPKGKPPVGLKPCPDLRHQAESAIPRGRRAGRHRHP